MNPEKPRNLNTKPDTTQIDEGGHPKRTKIPYEKWKEATNFVNALYWKEREKHLRRPHGEHIEPELDENIEHILICLIAHGFTPTTSCGGHMMADKVNVNKKEFYPRVPFIYIGTKNAEENRQSYARLSQLLENFYKDRPSVSDRDRIILKKPHKSAVEIDWTWFGANMTFGYPFYEKSYFDCSKKEIKAKIAACQKEIDDFVEFLKLE